MGSNIWRAAGRKQLRVCIALYNNDSFAAPPGDLFAPLPNYLRRSAVITRGQILTNPPDKGDELAPNNSIDREIRPIPNADGPEFRHIEFVHREGHRFRSLGCNFYSESFYVEVSRNAVEEQGRVGQIMVRMQKKCENELARLPKNSYASGGRYFSIYFTPPV